MTRLMQVSETGTGDQLASGPQGGGHVDKEVSVATSASTVFGGHARDTILVVRPSSLVGRAVLRVLDREVIRSRGLRLVGTAPGSDLTGEFDHVAATLRAVVYEDMPSAPIDQGETASRDLRRVLDLVEEAGVPLYHVRSAFTGTDPAVAQAPAELGSAAHATEVLLAARDLPRVVIRPSLLLGDGRTGAVPSLSGLHRMVGALLHGNPPSLPVSGGSLLDFVPTNIVATTIVGLIAHDFVEGEYWLTAGERAATIAQLVDGLSEFAQEHGLAWHSPRFGSTNGRNLRLDLSGRPAGVAELFLSHVRPDPLPSSLGDRFETSISELGAIGVPALPNPIESIHHSLRYWIPESRSRSRQPQVA